MNARPRGLGSLLLFWFAALLVAGVANAADRPGWSYRLSSEIMSPYCPGLSLSDCPSPQAAELRESIVAQERAGATRAEVEAMLLREFGDRIRQKPRAEGMGLVAYGAPALVFGLGGGLVWRFLRRRPSAQAPSDAPTRAAVDADLADRELEAIIDREIGV